VSLNEFFTKNARALVIYRLVIARFILFNIVTIGGAIMTALAGTNWSNCDNQTRFLIVVSVAVTWAGTTGAFLDQSLKRIADGKSPLPTNGTPSPFPVKQ
jgi:uncharacterized phage infection (PIP) family protein YhgE